MAKKEPAGNERPPSDAPGWFPDLAGKAAIVTGASRGIGVGIARTLGRQGMKLVLCARSEEAGQAVAAELGADGVECAWVTADLSTSEGARRVFDEAIGRFGHVHVLVNNAARLHSAPLLELTEEVYGQSFEDNVRMVYALSRHVARHMVEEGGGSIVNISSVGGLRAHRGLVGYDASKGAIDSMTRALALELAPHGIRVNAVAPGAMHVDRRPPRPAAKRKNKEKGIPLGRLGTPEGIGMAVAFLASEAAAYITGQILYVDGGLTAQLAPPGTFI
ncbi:MAG: SDR family oxidoreductase [Candidatus Brocadiae bacterium]|nr:SDR family oxidoreductase [Candidatus Brocadiia bacterium]